MTANCGHRICFSCVKFNRNVYKCSNCTTYAKYNKANNLSPTRNVSQDK